MTVSATAPVALHRLALALDCRDPLTGQPVPTPLRAGREVAQPPGRTAPDPAWPCVDLEAAGPGRFRLRYPRPRAVLPPPAADRGGLPEPMVLRVVDPARRVVSRRFTVHVWPLLDLADGVTPYVPVGARTLRLWLWPGAAAALPSGTTVLRGRVAHVGVPVRWARITATTLNGDVAGTAHADGWGEFVLVVTTTSQNPLRSTVTLDLDVVARRVVPAPAPSPAPDPLADLEAEDVPRTAVRVLDDPLRRGTAVPTTYAASTLPPLRVVAPVGRELPLPTDLDFVPQP